LFFYLFFFNIKKKKKKIGEKLEIFIFSFDSFSDIACLFA
jgi:hypothetical protein